jgi:hypothetical protein
MTPLEGASRRLAAQTLAPWRLSKTADAENATGRLLRLLCLLCLLLLQRLLFLPGWPAAMLPNTGYGLGRF